MPEAFDELRLIDEGEGYTTVLVNGTDLMDLFDGAGDCIGPGEHSDAWFFFVRREGVHEKRMILRCNCGYADCMSLWATVVIGPDAVTWDHFNRERGKQFENRFRFRREDYDAEVSRFLAQD